MHVCMYACMHVCMYACMHVCLRACMHVCLRACMHVCMYACMHVCMYACVYVCMYVCMYACVHGCMRTCTYTFMYVCLCVQERIFERKHTPTNTDVHPFSFRYVSVAAKQQNSIAEVSKTFGDWRLIDTTVQCNEAVLCNASQSDRLIFVLGVCMSIL